MYGKLSALFVISAYLIPAFVFAFREKVAFFTLKVLFKLGYINTNYFKLTDKTGVQILIFTGAVTATIALIGIVLGHYSRSISEDHGGGLSFIIGLGYIYFVLVIIVIYLIKSFSMSGYR